MLVQKQINNRALKRLSQWVVGPALSVFLLAGFAALVSPANAKNAAIIVGISQYGDNQLNDLKYPDTDAAEFSEFLKSFGEHFPDQCVITLTNKQATKSAIESSFRNVVDRCTGGSGETVDNFIFYYSGHAVAAGKGVTKGGFAKADFSAREFLAPYDAYLSDSYMDGAGNTVNDTFLKKEWFATKLRQIKANKVAVLLDACYSGMPDLDDLVSNDLNFKRIQGSIGGDGTKNVVLKYTNPDDSSFNKTITIISATDEKNVAREFDELKHGALTYSVLRVFASFRKKVPGLDNFAALDYQSFINGIRDDFQKTIVEGYNLSSFHIPRLYTTARISQSRLAFLRFRGTERKAQPGYVVLVTDPAKITVSIDGEYVRPDSQGRYKVNPGPHIVTVQPDGANFQHSETVYVNEGRTVTKVLNLRGNLFIQSVWKNTGQPGPGVDVYLQNQYLGNNNKFAFKGVIAGTFDLKINWEEVTLRKSISIRPGSPLVITLELEKIIQRVPSGSKTNKLDGLM